MSCAGARHLGEGPRQPKGRAAGHPSRGRVNGITQQTGLRSPAGEAALRGARAVVTGVAALLGDPALCWHPVGTAHPLGPAQVRSIISLGHLRAPPEEEAVAMDTEAPWRRPPMALPSEVGTVVPRGDLQGMVAWAS